MKSEMIERAAKAIYDLDPFVECGEYVDGFMVSPGGPITWEQAQARDAEFAPEYMMPITKSAMDAARAAIETVDQRVSELEALVTNLRMKLALANERPSDIGFRNLKILVEEHRFSSEGVGMAIRWRWGQISPILFPEADDEALK